MTTNHYPSLHRTILDALDAATPRHARDIAPGVGLSAHSVWRHLWLMHAAGQVAVHDRYSGRGQPCLLWTRKESA